MSSVELLTNEPMQKLLSRVSKSAIPPGLRSMVEARAGSLLSSIVLHTDQNRTWIAPQDASEPGPSVSACDSDLTAYEWDAFELYLTGRSYRAGTRKRCCCWWNAFGGIGQGADFLPRSV